MFADDSVAPWGSDFGGMSDIIPEVQLMDLLYNNHTAKSGGSSSTSTNFHDLSSSQLFSGGEKGVAVSFGGYSSGSTDCGAHAHADSFQNMLPGPQMAGAYQRSPASFFMGDHNPSLDILFLEPAGKSTFFAQTNRGGRSSIPTVPIQATSVTSSPSASTAVMHFGGATDSVNPFAFSQQTPHLNGVKTGISSAPLVKMGPEFYDANESSLIDAAISDTGVPHTGDASSGTNAKKGGGSRKNDRRTRATDATRVKAGLLRTQQKKSTLVRIPNKSSGRMTKNALKANAAPPLSSAEMKKKIFRARAETPATAAHPTTTSIRGVGNPDIHGGLADDEICHMDFDLLMQHIASFAEVVQTRVKDRRKQLKNRVHAKRAAAKRERRQGGLGAENEQLIEQAAQLELENAQLQAHSEQMALTKENLEAEISQHKNDMDALQAQLLQMQTSLFRAQQVKATAPLAAPCPTTTGGSAAPMQPAAGSLLRLPDADGAGAGAWYPVVDMMRADPVPRMQPHADAPVRVPDVDLDDTPGESHPVSPGFDVNMHELQLGYTCAMQPKPLASKFSSCDADAGGEWGFGHLKHKLMHEAGGPAGHPARMWKRSRPLPPPGAF